MAANEENVFRMSIENIFNSWTALQLAVTHGLGGVHSSEKAAWIVDATEQWFNENDDIEPEELEDFLAEILSQEFDTVVDDGSLQQVSKEICGCFRLCSCGNSAEVLEKISKLTKPALDRCVQQQTTDSDEDDEPGETEPPPQPSQVTQHLEMMSIDETEDKTQPTPDNTEDDGWEVVQRKTKKK